GRCRRRLRRRRSGRRRAPPRRAGRPTRPAPPAPPPRPRPPLSGSALRDYLLDGLSVHPVRRPGGVLLIRSSVSFLAEVRPPTRGRAAPRERRGRTRSRPGRAGRFRTGESAPTASPRAGGEPSRRSPRDGPPCARRRARTSPFHPTLAARWTQDESTRYCLGSTAADSETNRRGMVRLTVLLGVTSFHDGHGTGVRARR